MNTNNTKTPVVALYLRGSTSQSDEDSQRYSLTEYIKKRGYTIFREYLDHGIGGDTLASDRQYAPDVIEDARLGKFNILLVTAIDRIARDEEFGLNYIRRIEETGCKVYFVDQPYANTPDVYSPEIADVIKNSRTMLLMGARMEHTRIKSRTRASKLRDIKANIWPANGHVPDGYLLDPDKKGALIINPVRAPIIKRIFDLYVDDKLTIRQIVELLNKEGVPSVTAKNPERKWIKDSVQDKLGNKIYIGKLPVVWKMTGEVVHIYTCPPIIHDDKFDEAQAIMKERVKRSRGNHKAGRDYPFRPYLYCAACGFELHTMTSGACTPNENYHYGFRKPQKAFKYRKRCPDGCGRISEIKLVDAIYNKFGVFFRPFKSITTANTDEIISWLEKNNGLKDTTEDELSALEVLQKELDALRQQPNRIKDMYETNLIDMKELNVRLAKYNNNPRIRIVEEKIRQIKQKQLAREDQSRNLQNIGLWVEGLKKSVVIDSSHFTIKQKRLADYSNDNLTLEIKKADWRGTPVEGISEKEMALNLFSDLLSYTNRKELVIKLLKTVKRIDVNFEKRKLRVFTRIPRFMDGEISFEADPTVKRGRPSKKNPGNGGGKGGLGGINSSIQVASVNSSKQLQ